MKKIITLILLCAVGAMAAQWEWDGGHATNNNWSEPTNWTADAGYPQTAADTVTINSGSDSVVVDISDTCGPVTIGASYTGVWYGGTAELCVAGPFTMGANATPSPGTGTIKILDVGTVTTRNKICFYDLIVDADTKTVTFADSLKTASGGDILYTAGNITHIGQGIVAGGDVQNNSTGTMNWGSFLTMNGASGTLGIASTVGVQTSGVLYVYSNSNMIIDNDVVFTTRVVTIFDNKQLTISGAATFQTNVSAISLVMGDGAKLTVNKKAIFKTSTSSACYTLGVDDTINGSDTIVFCQGNAGQIATAPAIVYTGTGVLEYSQTVNRAGYGLTFTGDINSGTRPLVISTRAGTLGVFKLRSNTFTCGDFICSPFGVSDTLKYETANIYASGNVIVAANVNLIPGTSTIIKTGATSSITNLDGKRINNLIVRKNRGVVDSFPTTAGYDSLNNFTIDSGKVKQKKKPLWINNYYNYATNAGDTVNFDTTVEVRGDWRSFGNRKTDGINSPRIFTGANSPCTTAMSGTGGYFIWRRAKGSVLVDSGIISKAMLSMDSIGTLKTLDSTFIDSLVLCDSTALVLKSGNGFKARVFDTASINGAAGKLNRYTASTPGSTARLFLPAAYTLSYVSLTDITVSPAQVADATSVNGGGNTGWTFQTGTTTRRRGGGGLRLNGGLDLGL